MNVSLSQLQAWLGLPSLGAGQDQVVFSGLCTDSRAVTPGCVFVALRGERFDAHDFLDQVIAQGATAVVVERAPATLSVPALVVNDTRVALGTIGQRWRQQFTLPLIAVTGRDRKSVV